MTVQFTLGDKSYLSSFLLESLELTVTVQVFPVLADLLRIPPSPACGRMDATEFRERVTQARKELKLHGQEWTKPAAESEEPEEGSLMRLMGTPALELEDLARCFHTLNELARAAVGKRTSVIWS